ncbi:MAG TPA: TetR/AcrR family transcriptional regulator C-terminal domain-containing protein, partial [Rhodopila sp.]
QVSYEVRGPARGLDPAENVKSGKLEAASFAHIAGAMVFDDWDFEHAFEFGLSTILEGLSCMK